MAVLETYSKELAQMIAMSKVALTKKNSESVYNILMQKLNDADKRTVNDWLYSQGFWLVPPPEKAKTGVGNILSSVGNFIVDTGKLAVQGILTPVTALNGGKSVLGDSWNTTTNLGKTLDKGIDAVDKVGHEVGQLYVKTITGGIVDLSKGGIFEKDGLQKTINLQALAKEAANSEQVKNVIDNSNFDLQKTTGINLDEQGKELENYANQIGKQLENQINDMGLLDSLKNAIPVINSVRELQQTGQNTGITSNLLPENIKPTNGNSLTVAAEEKKATNEENWFKKQWDRFMQWKKDSPTAWWSTVIGIPFGISIAVWLLIKYVFNKNGGKRF